MAETGRIPARSIHGCWTCRLRKKKCDETHPACLVCTSLAVECYGYDYRKPDWMDNGVLQRAQASRIKHAMRLNKLKKREQQRFAIGQPHLSFVSGAALFKTSPVSMLDNTSMSNYQQFDIFSQDAPRCQASEFLLSCDVGTSWTVSPGNETSSSENSFGHDNYFFAHTQPATQYEDCERNSSSYDSSEGTTTSTPDPLVTYQLVTEPDSAVPAEDILSTDSEQTYFTPNEVQSSKSFHGHQHTGSDTSEKFCNRAIRQSILGGDGEDALFMHYLDQVFYLQYPFYHSRHGRGRGWLYSILRKAKSAYHAALALSERHLLSSSLHQNSDIAPSLVDLRTENSHHYTALQHLHTMIDGYFALDAEAQLAESLGILTSISQLLFWEVSNGGTNNWREHLHTASRFITTLLEARKPPIMPDLGGPNATSSQLQRRASHPEADGAIDILLGSFISYDILSSASTRTAPFLNIDHIDTLDSLGISLESLVGCRNSVMALILDISLLDKWKKEAQIAQKLSMVNLVSRGNQLKERLQQELKAIDNLQLPPSTSSAKWNSPKLIQSTVHPDISKIFALAAITYLHVVVSGAYPELPEIAESVSETILIFNSLQDYGLLQNVVWPFCVSGCLARKEQRNFFRDLVSRAGITQWSTGTCFEAYKIMEECWKNSADCSDSCDWATVMEQRGCHVLLR